MSFMLILNAYYPFELCQSTYLKYYSSLLACGVSSPRGFGNVTLWGTPLVYLTLELASAGSISKLTVICCLISVPALQQGPVASVWLHHLQQWSLDLICGPRVTITTGSLKIAISVQDQVSPVVPTEQKSGGGESEMGWAGSWKNAVRCERE